MISPATLQKLPSLQEVIGEMVQKYIDERGAGDLFDLKEVIRIPKLSLTDIGSIFYNMVNDNNYAEMVAHGKCPECAVDLSLRIVKGTEYEPEERIVECPKCHEEFNEENVGGKL